MRKIVWSVVFVVFTLSLTQLALAFRPAGWVYSNYPWAYDNGSGDWYWFSTADTQWVANMGNGQWVRLPQSAMASGWFYYQPPYAYAQGNSAWHYINEANTQWVVNMRTGVWSRFGQVTAPAGMVLIPAGTNSGTDPDFGAYVLTVDAFYMDKYEVTKAKWDETYTWAIANGYSFDNPGFSKAANHPVHTVNWDDVVKWCNARSEMEGRTPVYLQNSGVYRIVGYDQYPVGQSSIANGYRLPTDVEWSYAARGGVANRRFPWADSDEIQHARANYFKYSDSVYDDIVPYDTSPTRGYHPTYSAGVSMPYSSPVGSFAPNGYGLYDMVGNISEMTGDSVSPRVLGGSWGNDARYCRVGYSVNWLLDKNSAYYSLGFRTVLPAP